MRCRLRIFITSLWLFVGGACAHAALVVIVSGDQSPAYAEAAKTLVNALERQGVSRNEVLQLTTQEFKNAKSLAPKLFVALGTDASQALAQTELTTPVLCTLLPRSSFERVLNTYKRRASSTFSALYLDQPFNRQINLIQLALPAATQIGVLLGPESSQREAVLRKIVNAKGLALEVATVTHENELFFRLKQVLSNAEVLLAVADPLVFNNTTIQNILLSTFRAKVPLVGFSAGYARAGALFSLSTTPAQMGLQAAEMSLRVLGGGVLPAEPVYPKEFSIDVNAHVARALGLSLSQAGLTLELKNLEVGR